jgi:hypothetical protein
MQSPDDRARCCHSEQGDNQRASSSDPFGEKAAHCRRCGRGAEDAGNTEGMWHGIAPVRMALEGTLEYQ